MSREVMQQALEALDGLYLPGELERVNAAITSLRAALAAQPAPTCPHIRSSGKGEHATNWCALGAPQGEPVAWLYQHGETGSTRIVMPDQLFTNGPNQWLMVGPLYQHPPAPLQPVAWLDEATDCAYTRAELDGGSEQGMRPLYAAPPAAPSVPAGRSESDPTVDDMRAALTVAMNAGWIACSEQMPDDDIQVLVWATGQLFSDGNCWVAARAGDWFVDDDGRTVSGVTHWMDLPGEPEC